MSIVAVLLVSSIISIIEFSRISSNVLGMFNDNITSINATVDLHAMCREYNLEILAKIGDDSDTLHPSINSEKFYTTCDDLKVKFNSQEATAQVDSLIKSYTEYLLVSDEIDAIVQNEFVDSREWYFERLQPKFKKLNADITRLNELNYNQLTLTSETFNESFYRSITPGIVATGAGILLVLVLLYFILTMYVNPLVRMTGNLDIFRTANKPYKYEFEGDDELKKLNDGILDITQSNIDLRRRNKELRNRINEL